MEGGVLPIAEHDRIEVTEAQVGFGSSSDSNGKFVIALHFECLNL